MPAVIGDVFGLGDVYIRQVSPVTVGVNTSGNFITESGWSDLRSHGWFGGGTTPVATVSAVERIDFSNDTIVASTRGPLSIARRTPAATGNSNYGWYGGGWFSPSTPQINYSTVDRVDFSNDSSTASVRGPLASTRYGVGATGNSNYGWYGGGQLFDPATPSNTPKSLVDRIDFSNDSSTASPRGPLSSARGSIVATGNSNFGWFGGGYNPGNVVRSTVDRIDFSNDFATATARGPLSSARFRIAATGNSNYGWYCGGFPGASSTVDRIDFANDSLTASVRGPLSGLRAEGGGTGNSNYGWIGGTGSSVVDRIDFANDLSITSLRGSTALSRYDVRATSGQAKSSSIRLQKAGNFGWFGGQFNLFTPGRVSTVDRIDFSNDSVTLTPRGPLSIARTSAAAAGNSNYGWFGGGNPGNFGTTTVDRIDFSNDSSAASVRGSLIAARYQNGATGNSDYGWWTGGTIQPSPSLPPVHNSSTNRINFSNDLVVASLRGSLNGIRSTFGTTGNSNYGWFGGGFSGIRLSTVERIDFSNDSVIASPRGTLIGERSSIAATGNSNYGWFVGGTIGSGGTSTTQRIDFSNDSAIASPRGLLSLGRTSFGGTGNSNYGWFGGGSSGASPFTGYSRVDRINFSNDSATASVRGSLASSRYTYGATSNITR